MATDHTDPQYHAAMTQAAAWLASGRQESTAQELLEEFEIQVRCGDSSDLFELLEHLEHCQVREAARKELESRN